MSNTNFNCDVCGREVLGYTFVNGIKFCAKCYQETFGETEKDRQIADLQSQLQQANEIINNPGTLIFQQQQLIDNLKSQLAEKDVEIKKLNACVNFYKSYYISFNEKVIDELERVKDYFIEGYAVCKNFSDFYWNFTEQIDNQIEALTHQHEDEGE